MKIRGEGHQLLLQVTRVGIHFPKFVLEEGAAGEGHKGATVTLGIACQDSSPDIALTLFIHTCLGQVSVQGYRVHPSFPCGLPYGG